MGVVGAADAVGERLDVGDAAARVAQVTHHVTVHAVAPRADQRTAPDSRGDAAPIDEHLLLLSDDHDIAAAGEREPVQQLGERPVILVEAGRVASEGARSLSQNVIASSRDNVEQAADAIRSLAEAKSPTEYLQLQSEIARQQFDRTVAETSKLTESLVKLAGEAFQPLSNRATANAERFNTLVA